jgi:spermidine/putrescine-binding protein
MRRNGWGLGLLALALVLAIVAWDREVPGQPADRVGGTMVVASFGGKFAQALDEHYFQPFGRDAGVKVTMDPVGVQMVAKLQAQQAAGSVAWSLVMPHDQDTFAIAARGMLLPLPPEVKREALALYGPKIVSDWAIARGLSASVFACNPAVAARCPRDPVEFWNVRDFPGRRALYSNGWLENLMYALQADGVPADKLFPLDLDRAFRKLDELKPHVHVWWSTGDQSQQIFRDREVAMGVLWDGRAFGLAGQGVKLEISHRGTMLGWGSLAVPKGAPNPQAAWAFIRWYMAHPEAQGAVQKVTGYGESSPLASNFLPPDMRLQMASHADNIKQVVVPDLTWVSQHRADIVKRWTEWLQK